MNNKSVIIPQKTPKQLKENFLDNNPKYREIKDPNPGVGEFYTINEDDEVWMMQCPKGTDLSVLRDQKIKLPGRSNQGELETVAIEYPQAVIQTFGHKNRKGHNNIKIVPIQGSIILRRRLKAAVLPDETQSETHSVRVPMPTGIKERHPLHGIDYKSKLEISQEIVERLKRVDELSIRETSKKKSKSKKKTKDPKTIVVDSDGDVELVTERKSKKKKRTHSEQEVEIVAESPKKKTKKSRNSFNDEVAEDLQWIQQL